MPERGAGVALRKAPAPAALRTALACEAAFGVPVSELFAGLREAAGKAVGERLLALRSKLETGPAQGREARLAALKLRWLAERRPLPPGNTNTNS